MDDVITLIALSQPDPPTDESGYPLPPIETPREVFCTLRSLYASEFYASGMAGKQNLLKAEIQKDEYENQQVAELYGKRYEITRCYMVPGTDIAELTLLDLSQREVVASGKD